MTTFIFIQKLTYIYGINEKYKTETEKFYYGRILIDFITTKPPYSNNICNLTEDIFNLNISYIEDKLNITINRPYSIILKNLDNESEQHFGLKDINDYIEFRRVCYNNGSLYLVVVRIS